jgi:hypothetical protein
LPEEKKDDPSLSRLVYQELERKFQHLLSPEGREQAQGKLEDAILSLDSLATKGKEKAQFALDLLSELSREISGIESFSITPKPPAELEVEIRTRSPLDLPLRQNLAPFIELEKVILEKRIHFQALVDTDIKGLRCNLNEGFVLGLSTPLGKQNIPIKGSAILKRDKNKLIVLETTTPLPGVSVPVSITIPLNELLKKAGKSLL